MSERIERKDLLSDDAIQSIIELTDALVKSNEALKQFIATAQKNGKDISTSKSTKEFTENTKKAATNLTSLTEEQKKNTEASKKLQKAYENLAYAQSAEYKEIEKVKKATRDHQNEVKKAISNTNTWEKALGSFAFKFNFLGNALSSLSIAVGQKLVQAFVSFFTKSEKGMELMERKIAGFNASMAVLSGEFIKLGEAMTGNQDKAIKWGDYTKRALQLVAASANLIPGVRRKINDIAEGMNEASAAAEKYTTKIQDLEETEREMSRERSKTNLLIKQSRLAFAENLGTIQEQIDGLTKAFELENQLVDKEMEHAQMYADNLKEINDLKEKSGQLTDADKDKYVAALNKIDQLAEDSVGRRLRGQMKLTTEIEQLRKAENADYLKKIETQKQLDKEYDDAYIQILEQERAAEQKKYDDDLKAKADAYEAKLELDKEYEDAYIQILEDEKREAQKLIDEADANELLKAEEKQKLKLQIADAFLQSSNALLDFVSAKNNAKMEEELKAVEGNEKKQEEIKKKYARKQQNIQAAQAVINGAMAVTNLLANVPGSVINPATWVGIALAGVMTAFQVGVIKAQKFAKGTQNSPEGFHITGEQGTELMIAPDGSVGFSPEKASLTYLQKGTKIFPADVTRNIIDNMGFDSGSKQKRNEVVEALEKNSQILKSIENKPVTSVNIDSNGIGYITESKTTLTRRIDKYFRN